MKEIPQLGLWTWWLDWESCIDVVKSGLKIWYLHLDTAEHYHNEQFVGKWRIFSEKNRENFWLTTKIWIDDYKRLPSAFEESLVRLQTDYVDLLLLHRPTTLEQHKQLLDQMMKFQDQWKIKQIWVSNFTLSQLEHAWEYTNGRIYTNQIEYHPCLGQEIIKSFCDEKWIKITAYSPLGHGNLLKNQTLISIADKHWVSVAQVCIAWLLQQWCVVIPKASTRERLQDNFDAQKLVLDTEDLEIIAQLPKDHRYINPPFAPKWDI